MGYFKKVPKIKKKVRLVKSPFATEGGISKMVEKASKIKPINPPSFKTKEEMNDWIKKLEKGLIGKGRRKGQRWFDEEACDFYKEYYYG